MRIDMSTEFPLCPERVPAVTTAQMIEVDRAMIEEFGIDLIQMMENAGRCLADLARKRFLDGDPRGQHVIVLAGTGGNGGGGLVAARRLHNYGARVEVFLTKADADYSGVPAHQLAILRHMEVPVSDGQKIGDAEQPDLILDALIGYSLKGAPRNTARHLIGWANHQQAPILALDAPSGVDTSSGLVFDPAMRATATLTLALPKSGLRAPGLDAQVGELYLADISVPPELYTIPTLNLSVPHIFAQSDIVRLQ